MSQFNLKVSQQKRDDGKVQLSITVPAGSTQELSRHATFAFAMQSHVEPASTEEETRAKLIEAMGEPALSAFSNHFVMSGMAQFAVSDNNLDIILTPDVSSTEQFELGRDFHFFAVVTPKPEYELSSYEPVRVARPGVEITDAEIDHQLYMIAENNAEYIEDKGAEVKEGSEVVFGIETVGADGVAIPGLTAERRAYRLGEDFMPESFDKNIVGMRAGDVRTFDFEMPDTSALPPDFDADTKLPMVTVTTTITLTEVTKKIVPAITNAWVEAHMPEAQDVEGLRALIRESGLEHKRREVEEYLYYAVASELATRMEGSIPDEVYEHTRGEIISNLMAKLKHENKDMKQFLQQQGIDEQQFSMQVMLQTRETLRQGFSLEALARHLKMSVTEQDIDAVLRRMAPGKEDEARRQFEGSGCSYQLREAALRNKANQWLYDTAVFEPVQEEE
ncbi:MAG: hypothetical protein LBD25_00440 [Coriobacteriales bacterium]|jgi:trigger factor|nr:hypothetical protein [Coriobacteriales bacterium]